MSVSASSDISVHESPQSICYLGMKSEYSLVDGSVKLDDYLDHMARLGHKYVAITDNGGLFGAFDFYLKCRSRQMIPVIGSTLYMRPSPLFEQFYQSMQLHDRRLTRSEEQLSSAVRAQQMPSAFQMRFFAQNNQGYQTLTRLVSEAYQHALVDDIPLCSWDLMARHLDSESSKNLIVLSGSACGELTYHLRLARRLAALPEDLSHYGSTLAQLTQSYLGHLKQMMGEGRFYLEIFDHHLGDEKILEAEVVRLAEQMDLPVVACPEVYYLAPEDLDTHLIALAIKNSLSESEIHNRRHDVSFHLPAHKQFMNRYSHVSGAVENTMKIAEQCAHLNWNTTSYHLPSFPVPEDHEDKGVDGWLVRIAQQGLKNRLMEHQAQSEESYQKRLAYELSVVQKMGFSGYFLIVQDFIDWARQNHIPVGPGRGSGAGSLIAYCLKITDIDPLRWGLLFERFLNPERVSLPDFDIDFCQWRREEVISYVVSKYGQDRVAHICSFGKLMAKAALKSVARVMGVHYLKMNELTKMFPDDMSLTLSEVMASTVRIAEVVNADDTMSRAMDVALKLEGMVAHTSIHPAGMIISDRPITDDVPTFMTSRDQCVMSQYEMKSLEKAGLVKFDFLGLKTLSVIDHASQEISRTLDEPFEINQISLNDEQVYREISYGHTVGVFQAESAGMTSLARKLRPTHFEDIIALVALFRPGPLGSGMVDDFIERKHKRQAIVYIHRHLEPILAETYGMIVYQEQVQKIASHLARYSLGEADLLRRAMGKKIPEEMKKQQDRFVRGAREEGIDEECAVKIFDLMAEFAKYGFNKSHSAAYGTLLYQTAYLKAHYPLQFMLALMSSDMDHPKKIAGYIKECARLGIEIIPPSLEHSSDYFVEYDGKIVYALCAIKGLSKKSVERLLVERQKGPFTDLLDLAHRLNLQQFGAKNLELLVEVGALDDFGYRRTDIKAIIAQMVRYSDRYQCKQQNQQLSLLSMSGQSHHSSFWRPPEWAQGLVKCDSSSLSLQDLIVEKHLLGSYQSGHPTQYTQPLISLLEPSALLSDLINRRASPMPSIHEQGHRLVMFLESRLDKTTGSGQRVLRFELEGDPKGGGIDGVMYEKERRQHSVIPQNHRLVMVTGYLSWKNRMHLVIKTMEDAIEKLCSEPMDVAFEMDVSSSDDLDNQVVSGFLVQLKEFCIAHPGESQVAFILHITSSDRAYFKLTRVNQHAFVKEFLIHCIDMGPLKIRKDYRPRSAVSQKI